MDGGTVTNNEREGGRRKKDAHCRSIRIPGNKESGEECVVMRGWLRSVVDGASHSPGLLRTGVAGDRSQWGTVPPHDA